LEPDPNANDESALHDKKEDAPRYLTDAGMQNDCNDEHSESAFASIRVSFDRDSNVHEQSDLHDEREPDPRSSTEAGRQIDCNDEHT
jgi:hypothetical protein